MPERSEHQIRIDKFMKLAGQATPSYPSLPDEKVLELRANLILEEALETIEALGYKLCEDASHTLYKAVKPDLALALDGCADLSVVTIGTLSALGVDDLPLLKLVDENNLAKFGPGGYRRGDGKWVKPEGHKPPDIAGEIVRQYNEG